MKETDKLILAAISGLSIYWIISNPRIATAMLKAWKENKKEG